MTSFPGVVRRPTSPDHFQTTANSSFVPLNNAAAQEDPRGSHASPVNDVRKDSVRFSYSAAEPREHFQTTMVGSRQPTQDEAAIVARVQENAEHGPRKAADMGLQHGHFQLGLESAPTYETTQRSMLEAGLRQRRRAAGPAGAAENEDGFNQEALTRTSFRLGSAETVYVPMSVAAAAAPTEEERRAARDGPSEVRERLRTSSLTLGSANNRDARSRTVASEEFERVARVPRGMDAAASSRQELARSNIRFTAGSDLKVGSSNPASKYYTAQSEAERSAIEEHQGDPSTRVPRPRSPITTESGVPAHTIDSIRFSYDEPESMDSIPRSNQQYVTVHDIPESGSAAADQQGSRVKLMESQLPLGNFHGDYRTSFRDDFPDYSDEVRKAEPLGARTKLMATTMVLGNDEPTYETTKGDQFIDRDVDEAAAGPSGSKQALMRTTLQLGSAPAEYESMSKSSYVRHEGHTADEAVSSRTALNEDSLRFGFEDTDYETDKERAYLAALHSQEASFSAKRDKTTLQRTHFTLGSAPTTYEAPDKIGNQPRQSATLRRQRVRRG